MNRDMPLRREVFILIVAGAALGIAHNRMGLASHPARGIPWLAAKTELPRLEDMAPADSVPEAPAGVPAPEMGESGGAPAAPDGAAATTGGQTVSGPRPAERPTDQGRPAAAPAPRTPGAGTPGQTAGATPPASSTPGAPSTPAPSTPAPSTPAPSTPAPARPRANVPLPFIPASDQPIEVQISTAKRFFDARGALFLDARDPAEYEKGHIPGAIRLTNPEAQSEPERLKALPVNGRPIIAYCEGGTCEASLELARFLVESGFSKVLVYMGGFPEWAAAGHPVERGAAP